MKKIFLFCAFISIYYFSRSQCTPPSTFAVGPYYLPCGFNSVVISAGTNSAATTYSYTWTGPPFAGMSCPSGVSCYNTSVNAGGIYTVTIYDTSVPGCFSTNTLSVIQGTVMNIYFSGTDTICKGSTGYIYASTYPVSGPTSYTWSTGSNLSSINVSPTVTSVYSVTAYNSAYGCSGTNSYTVNVISCTGITDYVAAAGLIVAPNPNTGKFSVTISLKYNAEMIIYNTIGQEVYRQIINDGKNEINTGNLAKGIYHYNISYNKQQLSRGKILIE